jgi:hypothetical protein
MKNCYYAESNEGDTENNTDNFKDIFMNIGIQLNKQFINSDSESDSDSEIKRENIFNIGIYMHNVSFPDDLSFQNEINYNEIMNKVFQELLAVTVIAIVKNNYISDNYISDTDDEFFYLSDDDICTFS